jgi:hypothetical protein
MSGCCKTLQNAHFMIRSTFHAMLIANEQPELFAIPGQPPIPKNFSSDAGQLRMSKIHPCIRPPLHRVETVASHQRLRTLRRLTTQFVQLCRTSGFAMRLIMRARSLLRTPAYRTFLEPCVAPLAPAAAATPGGVPKEKPPSPAAAAAIQCNHDGRPQRHN